MADKTSFEKQKENGRSYLEGTYKLFSSLSDYVYVQCPNEIKPRVMKYVPSERIWTEPLSRGTAPALALAALQIDSQHIEEPSLFAFANQTVRYQNKLLNTLRVAENLHAQLKRIVLIGVAITAKTSKYGYIKVGKVLKEMSGVLAFEMKSFKRNLQQDEVDLVTEKWNYLWDTGYILSSAHDLIELYEETLPDIYAGLMTIKAARGTKLEKKIVQTVYTSIPHTTMSEGVIEKVNPRRLVVIPVDLGISKLFEKEL